MIDIKKNDILAFSLITIASLKYFAGLENERIFHGDIKPQNIFYKGQLITTDSGSLIYLSDNIKDN
jgi:predicted unusual protein kinase regulating ubiquinone biosynthesis (AarF/ABC1/UbiB family)